MSESRDSEVSFSAAVVYAARAAPRMLGHHSRSEPLREDHPVPSVFQRQTF